MRGGRDVSPSEDDGGFALDPGAVFPVLRLIARLSCCGRHHRRATLRAGDCRELVLRHASGLTALADLFQPDLDLRGTSELETYAKRSPRQVSARERAARAGLRRRRPPTVTRSDGCERGGPRCSVRGAPAKQAAADDRVAAQPRCSLPPWSSSGSPHTPLASWPEALDYLADASAIGVSLLAIYLAQRPPHPPTATPTPPTTPPWSTRAGC